MLLYSATLFLGAGLLFVMQPMVGKMVLPLLGGTPAVWSTCMVFFQAALLGGYAYAHASTAWLGVPRQMLQAPAGHGIEDEVAAGLVRAVAATLQERLNRRLQEVEWQTLAGIVRRFVADTLLPGRTEEIAADVYVWQFEEAELRELLRFQRSAVGRKAARLAPVIAQETAQALGVEVRRSPVMPRLLDELGRAFPVLRPPESP